MSDLSNAPADWEMIERVAENHRGAYGEACRLALRLRDEVERLTAERDRWRVEAAKRLTLEDAARHALVLHDRVAAAEARAAQLEAALRSCAARARDSLTMRLDDKQAIEDAVDLAALAAPEPEAEPAEDAKPLAEVIAEKRTDPEFDAAYREAVKRLEAPTTRPAPKCEKCEGQGYRMVNMRPMRCVCRDLVIAKPAEDAEGGGKKAPIVVHPVQIAVPDDDDAEGGGGEPEGYWLAETTDQTHRYLQPPKVGRPVGLTSDPFEAHRFATRYECERAIHSAHVRAFLPPLKATEHVDIEREEGGGGERCGRCDDGMILDSSKVKPPTMSVMNWLRSCPRVPCPDCPPKGGERCATCGGSRKWCGLHGKRCLDHGARRRFCAAEWVPCPDCAGSQP